MISKSKSTIEKSFEELSNSISDSDRVMIETRLLMYRFLSEIDKITAERRISRKELAILAGTSASYITQLYQGKKIINLQMLTRIKKALNIDFKIEVINNDKKTESDCSDLIFIGAKSKVRTVHLSHTTGNMIYAKDQKVKRPHKSL